MSDWRSPSTSFTFPYFSPDASYAVQPGSIRSQATDVVGVGEGVHDLEGRGDVLRVEPLQAAVGHLRRGAVAAAAGDPKTERAVARHPGGVERCEQERAARQVVARSELHLAEEVAPVVGERGHRGRPEHRRRSARHLRPLHAPACLHEGEGAADLLLVELAEQLRSLVGADPAARAVHRETQVVAEPAGTRRTEERSSARASVRPGDGDVQGRLAPVVRKARPDRTPLVRQSHAASA
jgi:hypothetical protein